MPYRGFSLSEMLVALAIAAILLGLGGPGLSRQRAEAALRTASGHTMAALHLGRRLALARGQSITVCPTTDGIRCGFGGTRWLMFANTPGGSDARVDGTDELLQEWRMPAGVSVSGTRGHASFQPRPGSASTVTFEFHHANGGVGSRRVIVSQTGRPRIQLN